MARGFFKSALTTPEWLDTLFDAIDEAGVPKWPYSPLLSNYPVRPIQWSNVSYGFSTFDVGVFLNISPDEAAL